MGKEAGPLIEMFWLVEYTDGSYCAQFDFDTFTERRYAEVNHKRAKRYWFLPVPLQLSGKLGLHHNPRLRKCCVENKGAMGFVARRTRLVMHSGMPVVREVMCYVVGIDGGPRIETYPDGTVIRLKEPRSRGEVQDVLR